MSTNQLHYFSESVGSLQSRITEFLPFIGADSVSENHNESPFLTNTVCPLLPPLSEDGRDFPLFGLGSIPDLSSWAEEVGSDGTVDPEVDIRWQIPGFVSSLPSLGSPGPDTSWVGVPSPSFESRVPSRRFLPLPVLDQGEEILGFGPPPPSTSVVTNDSSICEGLGLIGVGPEDIAEPSPNGFTFFPPQESTDSPRETDPAYGVESEVDLLAVPETQSDSPPSSRIHFVLSTSLAPPAASTSRPVGPSHRLHVPRRARPAEKCATLRHVIPPMPADGRCPACLSVQKMACFARHFMIHLPVPKTPPFFCGGLPVEDWPCDAEEEVVEYNGYRLAGGCMRNFSRRDAYSRHMLHTRHRGHQYGPWMSGNAGFGTQWREMGGAMDTQA